MDCEGMRLQGHGVQRACIVLIYFRLVFKPGTSQTYELPWSWRQDRHSILLPLVQAHFPSQALALKKHGHRFRRRHLLREVKDLIMVLLDVRDCARSNSIAFGNNVRRADL